MTRNHAWRAPSYLALLMAAGLTATPALAATTTITVPAGATQSAAVTASPAASDNIIVEVDGILGGGFGFAATGSGAGPVTINVDGRLQGDVGFGSATGPVTININSGVAPTLEGWTPSNSNTFGAGADTINVAVGGTIATTNSTTFDFGDGADTFNNAGRIIVERQNFSFFDGVLTINELEAFNNSGLILLGSAFQFVGTTGTRSDGIPGDRFIMTEGVFTGSGASRVEVDVDFGLGDQADCSTTLIADCLDFTGATTAGSTLVTVRHAYANGPAAALGSSITVVVGATAAEHFVLDPYSDDYQIDALGPGLQKGFITFRYIYDDATNQHRLVSGYSGEAVLVGKMVAPLQDTWRTSTNSWFTRQADLRAAQEDYQLSRGVWASVAGAAAERDGAATYQVAGLTSEYDIGYEQRTGSLTFGSDLLGGDSWTLGAALGVVRTTVEYNAAPMETDYSGFSGGLYASALGGPVFVDAVFNANLLDVATNAPRLELGDSVKLDARAKSLGGRIEAGVRLDLAPGFYVEPLAGVSYVKTKIDDIELADETAMLDFEDSYKSLRFGAGMRAGLTAATFGMPTAFSLTARYWDEQEADNKAALFLANGEVTTEMMDHFGGSFTDISGGVDLQVADGLSVFARAGGSLGDDYQSIDGALGLRFAW